MKNSMAALNTLVISLLFLHCMSSLSSAQLPPGSTKCDPIAGPSCACQPPDGLGQLDLSKLGSTDGNPMFTNIGPDPNNYVYSYNPCIAYTQNADCTNVFVCQTSEDGETSYAIAAVGTEEIYYEDDGTFFLYYSTNDGRHTKVFLNCDQSVTDGLESLTTDGDSKVILNYEFHLTSCHACPGGCTGKPPGRGGGNIAGIIGLVIILLAIAAIVVYFIVGAVIMKVKFQATGSDIVPNKAFWISLPGLIKDGCLFVVSPCVNAARGRQGYQQAK